jgi:hypothetical protein
VIIRVTRSQIRSGSEEQVIALVRAATSGGAVPAGLEDVHIGRRMEGSAEQLIAISVWKDLRSLVETLGPNWSEPTSLPGLDAFVESTTVDHFESLIDSYEELLAPTG